MHTDIRFSEVGTNMLEVRARIWFGEMQDLMNNLYFSGVKTEIREATTNISLGMCRVEENPKFSEVKARIRGSHNSDLVWEMKDFITNPRFSEIEAITW